MGCQQHAGDLRAIILHLFQIDDHTAMKQLEEVKSDSVLDGKEYRALQDGPEF